MSSLRQFLTLLAVAFFPHEANTQDRWNCDTGGLNATELCERCVAARNFEETMMFWEKKFWTVFGGSLKSGIIAEFPLYPVPTDADA